ncbi:hypothetical protein MTDW_15730 [Methylophilus sp. DW102]|jgi:hypothetical protein|nr:hypothetical protein MTDW_15730 [Methylophilus sp. DW102]
MMTLEIKTGVHFNMPPVNTVFSLVKIEAVGAEDALKLV